MDNLVKVGQNTTTGSVKGDKIHTAERSISHALNPSGNHLKKKFNYNNTFICLYHKFDICTSM